MRRAPLGPVRAANGCITRTLGQTPGPATTVAARLSPSSIVADGTSQSTATATITDALRHPIAGEQVSCSSSDDGDRFGAATDNHNGTYTATITSSTTAGTPTITATDSSVTPRLSGGAPLTQVAANPVITVTQLAAKPVITNLTESHHKFRVGKALATLASSGSPSGAHDVLTMSSMDALAKLLVDEVVALAASPGQPPITSAARTPPVGTVFSFTLNTAAQVQLAFAQTLRGRKVHGKCVAQNNQNQSQAKCRHTVPRGSIRFSAHAGTNRVSFAGMVSRMKKLGPAHYTMTLTATNSTGQSTPKTISFTVVK
ncbi:MAG: invasin domain 3-containing protein [Solirubrobacteraceae bacterium]